MRWNVIVYLVIPVAANQAIANLGLNFSDIFRAKGTSSTLDIVRPCVLGLNPQPLAKPVVAVLTEYI